MPRLLSALAILALLLPASDAFAEGPAAPAKKAPAAGSFEDAAQVARPAGDLALLVEPIVADCSGADAVATRRCNLIRASITEKLAAQQFVAVGDSASVNLAPYDAGEKEMALEVAGCLSCL